MTAARSRRILWLLSAATLAAGAILASQAPSAGAAKPVVEAPKVQSQPRAITRNGERKLLVPSLTVFHAHDATVRATCRNCRRLPGPKPQVLEPARGIVRFVGLNWVLDYGLHVRVYVTAPGAIDRYVVFGPARPLGRHRLVEEASGCLDGGHRVDCNGEGSPPSSTPDAASVYPETVGGDTETWTDYKSAGGLGGPLIHAGQTVGVSCATHGFAVADGDDWWYRIASSPWSNGYYASADAFYNNGQTSGSLIGTPPVDDAVPACS